MNSVYGLAVVTFLIVNVALVAQVNSFLESGQLIQTDSCICPEGIITYQCTIDVSQPGGFTIWNGTAFSCGQFNRILLRHSLFDSLTGAFGSCNDGIISGRSLGVSSDGTNNTIYTSQLQVNVTNSSRSGLVGRTVQCVYSPDATIFSIIDSTTIAITDPLPPPNDVQLTHVTPNQLIFNWSSVQAGCSTLQYNIESNCGTCRPNILSSATCSFELPINSNDVCNFAVRSTICANSIIGSLSTPVRVTLKLPDSPMFQSVIPTYNKETKSLINAEVIFADVGSFKISSIIDGAALYYVMDFIDSNPHVCSSSNISASSCDGNRICTVPPIDLTGCSQDGKINLSLAAFNLLGGGQATNYSIDGTNQYFDVLFESATRVFCNFRDQPENQFLRNKSCNITYGPCGQASSTTMTAQNISSDSLMVVINLQSQLANGYCYTVTASNGASSTVKIQGTFTDSQGSRTVAIAVGVVVSVLVIIIITLTIIIFTAVIIPRKCRRYRGSGGQEVHRRPLLLDNTDSGDNVISPHIIYDLDDRPEKLTESLRTLSQNNVNIKNIKICPSVMDKSRRTVYVECDHSLEEEIKEKLEDEATQLGSPGTLRVYTHPEPNIKIEKDEDAASKRVQKIEEVLKHEPGALYSLLDTFQRAEDLRHISITDIIHEDVDRENCKKVVIKFIPELPRNWKDNYNIRRKECDFIVPDSMSDESTSLL